MSNIPKIVISAAAFIGIIIHIYPNKITLDEISVILMCIGILPWVSEWLSSIKMGGFEAKFRELEDKVVKTEKELDNLKLRYSALEEEYLETCNEFVVFADSSDLDKLASKLKAKAKGLSSIDFLFSNLSLKSPQGRILGAACAIHVRPQFHVLPSLVLLIEEISSTKELKPFRLKVAYRLIMAIDSIVNLNNKNDVSLIEPEYQQKLRKALEIMSNHPYFVNDDVSQKCITVAEKL
jgi:hypothetical protein